MSYFRPHELHVAQVDAEHWRVTRGFSFIYTEGVAGTVLRTVAVKEDFITDFASVPRPFRFLIPKSGEYNMATVVHDVMCVNERGLWTRKQADETLREAMRALGVPMWKRWLIYAGVRAYAKLTRKE